MRENYNLDINTYEKEITSLNTNQLFSSFYYLREFVFWGGSYGLYSLTNDFKSTLLFWDFLCLALSFLIVRNYKLPNYVAIVFFISFMGVLGEQNVLRQFIASILFITSLSFSEQRKFIGMCIFFIISILVHNSLLLFAPLLLYPFLRREWLKKGLLLFWFIVMTQLLPILSSSKSTGQTGQRTEFLYLIVIILSALFFITNRILVVKKNLSHSLIFVFFLLCTEILAFVYLQSLERERLGIICLNILLPYLFMETAHWRQKRAYNILIISLISVPTFLSSSVSKFLIS